MKPVPSKPVSVTAIPGFLLILAAALEAIYACVNFFMRNPDGSLALRKFGTQSTVILAGKLALAAGICIIVAALWRSASRKSWLLVLNGVALSALGLVLNGLFGSRISFRVLALLLVIIALSVGIFQLIARQRFFHLAGAASLAFALAFLAFALRWIKLQPGAHWDFLWFGSYFAFSAICMLALALVGNSAAAPRNR